MNLEKDNFKKVLKFLVISFVLLLGIKIISNQQLDFFAKRAIDKLRINKKILKLQTQKKQLPLIEYTLRDNSISTPSDEYSATDIALEIQDDLKSYKISKGSRRAELYKRIYTNTISLSYYFEDSLYFENIPPSKYSANLKMLKKLRNQAIKRISKFIKLTKIKKQINLAYYHLAVISYNSKQIKSATRIIRKLKLKNIPFVYRNNAKFILASYDIYRGSKKGQKKALKLLISLRNKLNKYGQVSSRLLAAKKLAGISRNGKKNTKSNKKYNTQLKYASKKAANFSKKMQEEVLSYIVSVWYEAQRKNLDWSKPPFDVKLYKNTDINLAFKERQAIALWKKRRKTKAINIYKQLAESKTGQIIRASIDAKLILMTEKYAKQSKNPTLFERELIRQEENYLDSSILGDNKELITQKILTAIKHKHKQHILKTLTVASRAKSSKKFKRLAINSAQRFLEAIDEPKFKEKIQHKLAAIYVSSNKHEKAVELFQILVELNNSKKAYYLQHAIASQMKLSNWKSKVTYSFKTGNESQRAILLEMFEDLQRIKTKDWYIVAQIGMLKISLNRSEEAFADWSKRIQLSPKNSYAYGTAGYILTVYKIVNNWNKLEQFAKMLLKLRTKAVYKGKYLVIDDFLALALLNGGKKHLDEQNYAKAIKKYEEFLTKYKKHKQRDEAFYYISFAYQGSQEFKKALLALTTMVTKFKRSKYLEDSYYQGSILADKMAAEESTIFFQAQYLKKYSKRQKAMQIRESLTALYIGRQIYNKAIELLVNKINDRRYSQDEKEQAQLQILNIQKDEGSNKSASNTANLIIRNKKLSQAAKTNAYKILTDIAVENSDYKKLRQIKTKVTNLSSNNLDSLYILGKISYTIATKESSNAIKDEYNLGLRDPYKAINKKLNSFEKARAKYIEVCDIGSKNWCALANKSLSILAQNFIGTIEDIEIQEELALETVDRFNQKKSEVTALALQVINKANSDALAQISDGQASPEVVQDVLWYVNSDLNFNTVSGESVNAYVQWTLNRN